MAFIVLFFAKTVLTEENVGKLQAQIPQQQKVKAKAAIIPCEGLIDDGLYKSIQRRTQLALDSGADYLIFPISTYGGLVKSADDISKHLILEIGEKATTIAYVKNEAISAGAMISVSCNDIIMRENTTIGDSAPIVMGQKLEGVEREKTESFIRAIFARAAQANGYPEALLKAMVTDSIEVYRVKNNNTDQLEFVEGDFLANDPNTYDQSTKQLIVKAGQLLTLTAADALEYGIARAVVDDLDGAMSFLENRDKVSFDQPPTVYQTSWSEEMVRLLNSPAVTGILFMVGLLGLYIEFNTPGLGLPGLAAVICFVILFGSRFLVDLANWVEVAVFIIGIALLMVEFFVIPGFGIAGILGITCILGGLFGMLIKNPPDKLPIPANAVDWYYLRGGVMGLACGFVGFVVLACILARFIPKMELFSPLMLKPFTGSDEQDDQPQTVVATGEDTGDKSVKIDDVGTVATKLRPAGKAKFGDMIVDVVSDGDFINIDSRVKVKQVYGNRVVVSLLKEQEK